MSPSNLLADPNAIPADPGVLPLDVLLHLLPYMSTLFVGYVVISIARMWITRSGTRVVYRDRVAAPKKNRQGLYKPTAADEKSRIARIWALACAARDEFVAASTEFECGDDALADQLFRRPLLTDVTEPLTAAWLDAKSDFDVRFPARAPKTAKEAEAALQLARATRNAWNAADRNARCIGLGTLSEGDARRLDLAQQLLSAARDRGTTAEERRSQVLKVVEILVALTGRPEKALSAQIQNALNPWLASIGAPQLQLAIRAAEPGSSVPSTAFAGVDDER